MNASRKSVNALLDIGVQYRVPLYQRRYVWDEVSWKDLWEDIIDQEKRKSSKNAKHFTGPIVTRRIKGQQNRYEVIDGQQRLMTFQIIFCIIRDLCDPLKCCGLKSKAIDHLKNSENTIKDFESRDTEGTLRDPDKKFIPSKYDKSVFDKIINEILNEKCGDIINEIYNKYNEAYNKYNEENNYPDENKIKEARSKLFQEVSSKLFQEVSSELFRNETFSQNVLQTYIYFYLKIRKQVQRDTNKETRDKIDNLLSIIKFNFELVQITPGDSQQAEEIFESVNATGRKLSEFDYLRNNLFLRARDQSDEFYEKYWIFENDPDGYNWHEDRLKSFFQAFLMAKLGPDALNNDAKLFDVYHQKLEISGPTIREEFEDIKNYAETYKKLDVDPGMMDVDSEFKTRMQFYEDLRAYENEESYHLDFGSQHHYNVAVVRSFIMHLQQELNRPRSEILEVLEILESHIVRRMLIDTVVGRYAYNTIKAFFRILCEPNFQEFTVESLVEHLASTQSWLSNDMVSNWFKGNENHNQSGWFTQALGFTERYIFYRIENQKRTDANEGGLSFTTAEFPTYRKRVRTLTQLSYAEDAWASLGNLTFCWENRTMQGKDKLDDEIEILKHDVNRKLRLNREICDEPKWDPDKINKREEELFSIFLKIWKENPIIKKHREEIQQKYQIGSEVTGRVVTIVKFGVFVELEPGIDGLLHVSEMSWTRHKIEPSEIVRKGANIRVKILEIEISETEWRIRLSLKQMYPDPWVEAANKYNVGSVVTGRIVELTHFGAFAELEEGIEGLIHISELAYRRIDKPEAIVSVGEELELKVIELKREERRISLSLKAMQTDPWEEVVNKYKVGDVLTGKIVKFTNYGAFAELEAGIRGLIYNSELAHRHIKNPNQVVSLGQKLELRVIRIDRKARGIRLSLKQTQTDPWVEVCEKYQVGSVVQGKIVDILDRGVYVELSEKVTDFIHISELADQQIEKPEDIVSIGEKLDLKVIGLDPEKRSIALSLKAMESQNQER